jgi:hypothetical protein
MQRWLLAPGGGAAWLLATSSLLFNDTQEQFKESVCRFAQEAITPRAAAIDTSSHFLRDVDLWRLMGDFNLHGLTASEEYGWMGLVPLHRHGEITRAFGAVGLSYGALLPELASAPGSCSSNLQPRRRSSSSILFCARTLLPSSVHARPMPPALGPCPRCRCSPTAAVLLPAALALVTAVEFSGVYAPSPSSSKSPLAAAHSVLVDAVLLPML